MAKKKSVRSLLVGHLNSDAQDTSRSYNEAREACLRYAFRKREIAWVARELGVKSDEASISLSMIMDEQGPTSSDDDLIIERAREIIQDAYENGKYEGRDVASFIRVLLGRISDELLLKFDER